MRSLARVGNGGLKDGGFAFGSELISPAGKEKELSGREASPISRDKDSRDDGEDRKALALRVSKGRAFRKVNLIHGH